MKIGLIEAHDPARQLPKECYPLQLGYLASYLQKMNRDCEVTIAESLEELLKGSFELIGISSYSLNYTFAVDFARQIKETMKIPVILGGIHISALPATLHEVFDLAVVGEGEDTFSRVVSLYREKGAFLAGDLSTLEGIAFHAEGAVRSNPRPAPIFPLSKIPPPARNLYRIKSGSHFMSTSRGCPYDCLFCAPQVLWGKTRFFNAQYVLFEIGEIVRRYADTFDYLIFVDDLFIADRKRLLTIRDLFVSTGLSQAIASQVCVRADLVDEGLMAILKDMRVKSVLFGAESGSDRILSYYHKRNSTAINQRAIDMLYENGFDVTASFIIGAPVETEEEIRQTMDFIAKNHKKLRHFEIFPMIAMPGSKIWDYELERGLVSLEMDWSKLEPRLMDFDPDRYIFLCEHISPERFVDLVKECRQLFVEYRGEK